MPDASAGMEMPSMRPSPAEPPPPHVSDAADDDDDDDDDDEDTGLTARERHTRRHGERAADDENGMARAAVVRRLATNGVLVGLWYCFSIAISVYNKWMFSADMLDFHFPLFTTSLHMLMQFALASAVIVCRPQFRPGRDGSPREPAPRYQPLRPPHTGAPAPHDDDDDDDAAPAATPLITPSFYLTRVTPCGAATALDIGLGNFSLRFISLTFFTMCKSSVLAFVLLFALVFGLERASVTLCAIIACMTVGVVLMVSGEAAFDARGFALVMAASLCSGFRWSLTQMLLRRHAATANPFSSIFFLTPSMFAVLVALAVPIEGPAAVAAGVRALAAAHHPVLAALILLCPGCLAFLMVAAEFALLQRTSVVTLSVCGIFKEVLTISAAGLAFGDALSPVNLSGLVVTVASIAAYNALKYARLTRGARDGADARRRAVHHASDAASSPAASSRSADADADADACAPASPRPRPARACMRDPSPPPPHAEPPARAPAPHRGAMQPRAAHRPVPRPPHGQ